VRGRPIGHRPAVRQRPRAAGSGNRPNAAGHCPGLGGRRGCVPATSSAVPSLLNSDAVPPGPEIHGNRPAEKVTSATGVEAKFSSDEAPGAGTAAMQSTVESLVAQIEENHLLSPKDLEAVQARWFRAGRKDVQDAARFCEWLRVNNYL